MTNYENDIIALIPGETPKQKYDYIKNLLWQNSPEQEVELLNTIYKLSRTGKELFASSGGDSYVQRCAIFDVNKKIYHLTNKCKIDKIDFGSFLSSHLSNSNLKEK